MSDYRPVKGDRVRVVLEGEVAYVGEDMFRVGGTTTTGAEFGWFEAGHSVEKIEPPVEVFKPGDVVRETGGKYTFALSDQGYINLGIRQFYGYRDERQDRSDLAAHRRGDFTSDRFERVTLS